jgi:putative transcriptional regulator
MISLFEHWRRDPSLALAYRLADALGKRIDEVFPHERQAFPPEERKATAPELVPPSNEAARLRQNQVRASRGSKCWSQGELAERVGVSTAIINAIERGRLKPSLALAYAISQVLGQSVLDLFPLDAFRKVTPLGRSASEETVPMGKGALNTGVPQGFPPDTAGPTYPEDQSRGGVD